MKNFCVVIGVTRRDMLPLLKGGEKPTDTAKIADYNRANEDLYVIMYLLVELPAALGVQKYEDESEISGDGQAASKELCRNYDKVTDEVIRATVEELVNTPMEPGQQNPDDYFIKKRLLRIRIEKMGEKVSDRWYKDICVTGFTDEYKDVKMMMYRDSSFDNRPEADHHAAHVSRPTVPEQGEGTHSRAWQRHNDQDIDGSRRLVLQVQRARAHQEELSQCQAQDQARRSSEVVPGPPELPRAATKSATAEEQHGRTRRRASLLRARAARTAPRETRSPPPRRQPPPRTTNHQTARSLSSTSPAATTTSTAASCSQQQLQDDSPPAPRAQRYWSRVVHRNHSSTTN